MILSDQDLRTAIEQGDIEIVGPYEIQPASVDLHLSGETPLAIGTSHHGPEMIDPRHPIKGRMIPLRRWSDEGVDGWLLPPRGFALASTSERVRLGCDHVGRLEGKSSLARLGLTVHITAGFFDPGFEGYPTLELFNNTPYAFFLIPGMPICQMAFEELSSSCAVPYRGKYAGQGAAPAPSQYHKNFPLTLPWST